MSDDYELVSDPGLIGTEGTQGARTTLVDGLWRRNAITVQVLGLCSALAVTARVETALVMGITVTVVCALSGVFISLLRGLTPRRIRLITWVSIIATFVILADQICKALWWEISMELGPYLALVITNCILLGRAESFASRHRPVLAALDGIACGLGYAVVLVLVGVIRELLGSGQVELTRLVGRPVVIRLWEGYPANDFLLSAAGAFMVLGVLVACFNWTRARRTRDA